MGMKSHFFAESAIERCIESSTRIVCIREIQKSIKQSVKLLLEDKVKALGVQSYFDVLETEIRGKRNNSLIIFQGMQNHTADSIKSLEGFDVSWWEEAQTASQRSLTLLRPTIIRKPTAEMWFSWNPESEDDPIEALMRGPNRLKDAVVVETSYLDNIYLTDEIKAEIEADRLRDPNSFAHIWLGQYRIAVEGAVFADEMAEAVQAKRITCVPHSEAKPVDVYWDLGEGDGCAVWYEQQIGFEHHFIDYHYEHHKKIGYHLGEMQKRKYNYRTIWLPHDAEYDLLGQEKTIKQQVQDAFPNADVRIVEAAGKPDSIKQGINLARTIFSKCYFDKEKCTDGLKALRHWHYKKDEATGKTSVKPFHDWSSHGSSAFMYFAMAAEEITQQKRPTKHYANSWLG